MNSLTTEFSTLKRMLSMICLTSCLKKSIGLSSLISPGSYFCMMSICWSRIASLKLS